MQDASQIWKSGYTPPVPFSISLPDGGILVCEEIVRAMPGRRFVFRGQWDGNSVFIKVFADNFRAEREWKNEQRGIDALREAAIPAPEIILGISLSSPAMHVLVSKELVEAKSARDLWLQGNDEIRRKLFEELVVLLSTHHAAGIRQNDMHLNNFIYSEDVLYTLDAADINIIAGGLSKTEALENLVALLSLSDADHDDWIHDLYIQYARHSGWEINSEDEETIRQRVKRGREYKLRKYLVKIFRDCSAFVSKQGWRKFYVYDRDQDDAEFRELIADPDHLPEFAKRKMIKDGNTCTVTGISLASREFVCKRYNIKNIWHAMNRALRPTRASQSWRNAHRLIMYRVATAKPAALIEQRFGPLRGKAWFIMHSVPGPRLSEYVVDSSVSVQERMKIVDQFIRLLQIMHREQVSHGDMKAANFIINDGRLVVVDLDSLRVHRKCSDFERAFRRDLRRFCRNFHELPEISRLFRDAIVSAGLQNYLPAE